MSRIELAPDVVQDSDRILDRLARYAVDDAASRIREIIQAIDVLEHNPFIGRPVDGNKRVLVIGRRSRGYVALYRYVSGIACSMNPGAVVPARSAAAATRDFRSLGKRIVVVDMAYSNVNQSFIVALMCYMRCFALRRACFGELPFCGVRIFT